MTQEMFDNQVTKQQWEQDNMKQVALAFIKAKRGFSAAIKGSTNPHFKSKYADLAMCIEAVDDAFLSNGIVMYQETFEDATGVTVETVLLHESGESIRCGKLHVPASKQDAPGYGSALTYARRYSLMAACGIAPEDDDGNAAAAKKPEPAKAKQDQPLDIDAALKAMRGAADRATLDKFYKSATNRATGDQLFVLDEAYSVCKQVLEAS